MKIDEVGIAWFRGAAERIALRAAGRSVVVWGPNGSGKTSFVDGLEFLLSGGKIVHLSHEYSGRRMEKAIVNTHSVAGAARSVEMRLVGGGLASAVIADNGAPTFAGTDAVAGVDCGRIILRQDEVANFVHSKKGEKYSALLPLIGLEPLENVASNIRTIARKARDESGLDRMKGQLQQLRQQWDAAFPGLNGQGVAAALKALHAKYLPGAPPPTSLGEAIEALKPELAARVAGLNAENARFLLIRNAADAGVADTLDAALSASEKAAALAEPLLEERLAVLKATDAFGGKLRDEDVPCPACGRDIPTGDLKAHVAAEKARLEAALAAFEARRLAFGRLADAVATARGALRRPDMADWLGAPEQDPVRAALDIDPERLRAGDVGHEELTELKASVAAAAVRLADCLKVAPPSVEQLVADLKSVEAASSHPTMKAISARITSVGTLLAFLGAAEAQVRDEIKVRTEAVIGDISADMQRMWAILHPDEPIDEVRLYQAEDADKAVDIALRFHGKQQASPRLTLSEGHRNSLGLCVFLALAKRGGMEFPLVLDDVVTSFDREHRAFVADLLMGEFGESQIIVFTHDYEWYAELRTRLPGGHWSFKALMPWSDPSTGIRWDSSQQGLDAARRLIDVDPMSAANKARAIMDVQMAVICERLEVPMPFLRGARNDGRHALDFVQRFRSRSGEKMRRSNEAGAYEKWPAPAEAAKAVEGRLVAYGNAGTHGRYVNRAEAKLLISECEAFFRALECDACGTAVWHVASSGNHLHCACGKLRWDL